MLKSQKKDQPIVSTTKCLSVKNIEYLNKMSELLTKIQPNKVIKMVNKIKAYNHSFQEYINQNRLMTIKYEDVYKFQKLLNKRGAKRTVKMRRNLQAIKIGFLELKKKMEEFEVTDFISQIKYTNNAIERGIQALQKMGYRYIGAQDLNRPIIFIDEIEKMQKQNGPFHQISPRTMQKSKAIQKASLDFYQKLRLD